MKAIINQPEKYGFKQYASLAPLFKSLDPIEMIASN